MRVKADIVLESEPYSDMFAPIDLRGALPSAGDVLVLADVPCTCTRRRFDYDAGGRLSGVTLYVERVATPAGR